MLKDRHYYEDVYRTTFTAKLMKNGIDENDRPYVVLDNTAFYPTGGGQPHDTGTLNGIEVMDVEEVDGEILHFLAKEGELPSNVEGVINWERRFDHMQQHAGQHILTAAFVELFGIQTISFHLGREMVTIDLDVSEVTDSQLAAAEKRANEIILQNRPIETKWVSYEETAQYPLRKQLAVEDEIRLVIIPDFDYNGCGGTHPASTGEIGLLKILSTEKQKKKIRVHFVCGNRVLQQLHRKNEELSEASKLLSAPESGVTAAIEKLIATNQNLEKALEEKKDALLSFEANELLSEKTNGIVRAAFYNRTVQELQKLSRLLVALDEETIVVLTAENEERLQFVAARGAASDANMKAVASSILPKLNGKGGGNEAFVQGGGERTMGGEQLADLIVAFLAQ